MDNFIHTRRLAQFLEMESMGAVELKRTVEKTVPRELSYHDFDGKVVNARELLISEGIQGSTLIPTEIYATVIEGAEPQRCFREVLPMYQMKGMVMAMPIGATGTYAPVVAEGAEIPIEDQTYTSVTFTAKKYGVRPVITNEMVDDALFDIIAAEVRKGGMRLENALNKAAVSELLDAHLDEVDLATGATPLLGLAAMQNSMLGNNMMPNHIVMCPEFYGDCMQEGLILHAAFANDMMRSGKLGQILGMPVSVCSTTYSSTHIWEFDTDADVGAMVLDTTKCGAIGMRQDIKVEQYADSIRQMQGVSMTMRFDVQALNGYAIGNMIH